MNKESYLFDRIRWGAAIFFIFHISLLFILFLQDWKTEKMKWFILFLGVLYVILLYAAYQLLYAVFSSSVTAFDVFGVAFR